MDEDIETPINKAMPSYFSSPSNSERKDAKAPSSVLVLYRPINPLNYPLDIPGVVELEAGAGPFSAEGVVPDLLQKT